MQRDFSVELDADTYALLRSKAQVSSLSPGALVKKLLQENSVQQNDPSFVRETVYTRSRQYSLVQQREALTFDKIHIWHPFTQEYTAPERLYITRGEGVWLYDIHNTRYMDLISSWWVTLHGHANKYIANAIYEQMQQIEHVIFAECTHNAAVQLCQRLQTVLPAQLSHYFFSENGSTAVEVALKMAYQYWYNKGEERTQFIAFEGGYHGDTLGGMSVGANSGYHNVFRKLFFSVKYIPYPVYDIEVPEEQIIQEETIALQKLTLFLEKHGTTTCALILEPCIQGASGMRVCRVEFQQKVIELVRTYGILVIFDEVMTGFGRTGPYFALEHLNIVPDFICLAKGLTGGFTPLALTITTDTVYNTFLDYSYDKAFLHGHSYTANPIGCAAGVASFDLLVHPDCAVQRMRIEEIHNKNLYALADAFAFLKAPRSIGTIGAINCTDTGIYDAIKTNALQHNLLLRPIKNVLYLMPPYCITEEELQHAYDMLHTILHRLSKM